MGGLPKPLFTRLNRRRLTEDQTRRIPVGASSRRISAQRPTQMFAALQPAGGSFWDLVLNGLRLRQVLHQGRPLPEIGSGDLHYRSSRTSVSRRCNTVPPAHLLLHRETSTCGISTDCGTRTSQEKLALPSTRKTSAQKANHKTFTNDIQSVVGIGFLGCQWT